MARRFVCPLLLALVGCSVDSTVGYNDGAVAAGVTCREDALSLCEDQLCTVEDVFDAPCGAVTLAADASNVYFSSGENRIGRHALGSGENAALASTSSTMMRMTSDATHVFWTEVDGNVRGVLKTGGPRFEAGYVFGNPTDLTVDASHIYWIFPEFGQVAMAPKPSGPSVHISDQGAPQAIVSDRTHVYWVNAGSGDNDGQLVRARGGDLSSAEVMLSGLEAPVAIALGDDAVYWASSSTVFRLLKGKTTAQTVTTGLTELKAIGVRGRVLYGASLEGLWRVPVSGGAFQQLERRPVSAMTLTCSAVYGVIWHTDGLVKYGP